MACLVTRHAITCPNDEVVTADPNAGPVDWNFNDMKDASQFSSTNFSCGILFKVFCKTLSRPQWIDSFTDKLIFKHSSDWMNSDNLPIYPGIYTSSEDFDLIQQEPGIYFQGHKAWILHNFQELIGLYWLQLLWSHVFMFFTCGLMSWPRDKFNVLNLQTLYCGL